MFLIRLFSCSPFRRGVAVLSLYQLALVLELWSTLSSSPIIRTYQSPTLHLPRSLVLRLCNGTHTCVPRALCPTVALHLLHPSPCIYGLPLLRRPVAFRLRTPLTQRRNVVATIDHVFSTDAIVHAITTYS